MIFSNPSTNSSKLCGITTLLFYDWLSLYSVQYKVRTYYHLIISSSSINTIAMTLKLFHFVLYFIKVPLTLPIPESFSFHNNLTCHFLTHKDRPLASSMLYTSIFFTVRHKPIVPLPRKFPISTHIPVFLHFLEKWRHFVKSENVIVLWS